MVGIHPQLRQIPPIDSFSTTERTDLISEALKYSLAEKIKKLNVNDKTTLLMFLPKRTFDGVGSRCCELERFNDRLECKVGGRLLAIHPWKEVEGILKELGSLT